MKTIPHFELNQAGEPLHFLHANGYPPDCYQPLLELFKTNYHVFGMLLRPLWNHSRPNEIEDWKPFSEVFDIMQSFLITLELGACSQMYASKLADSI